MTRASAWVGVFRQGRGRKEIRVKNILEVQS